MVVTMDDASVPSTGLPSFLDKSPQIPIFACAEFWNSAHSKTFLSSPRYAEMLRFSNRDDASFSCLWHLVESMHLCTFGKPCRFTKQMGVSPPSPPDQKAAATLHSEHRASRALKDRVSTLVDSRCRQLRAWLPMPCSDVTLASLSTRPILPPGQLKRTGKTKQPSVHYATTEDVLATKHPPERLPQPICVVPAFAKPVPVPKC